MKLHHNRDYRRARGEAYPSIQDQLDALWKGGEEAENMRRKVNDVKTKYPKNKDKKT